MCRSHSTALLPIVARKPHSSSHAHWLTSLQQWGDCPSTRAPCFVGTGTKCLIPCLLLCCQLGYKSSAPPIPASPSCTPSPMLWPINLLLPQAGQQSMNTNWGDTSKGQCSTIA
ncbi:hypothetical protein XELAEV_18024660mg [Xenopus laevis]|uniref:Uncharacterized protein n=1 Tax=Xenopus laevis TaxID=8355 RepID=A0A974CYH5_XENLA|nr:hypothetical protein XELAEV_18024660mg [Xenopus laevis]